MKKAEKEALQREYTAAYLRSRIPLEAWCQENGHIYNTVRRFIKKPPKDAQTSEKDVDQSAQNAQNAQKKVRKTAQKEIAQIAQNQHGKKSHFSGERKSITEKKNDIPDTDDPGFNPDEFRLSEQQGIFAENVAAGKKIIEAYRIAGYEGEGSAAYVTASQLLRNPKVYRAVSFLRDQRQKRLSLAEDEIIHQLSSIASANPNELIQYRRLNCRYCWGERHFYQWRDIEEFDKAAEKAANDGKKEPEYGGLGFVETGYPNEECPRCNGEGIPQLHVVDTTQLEGSARWLYAGIKQTQNGLEIRMANQEAARRDLLKIIETRKSPAGGNGNKRSASDYSPDDYRDAAARLEDEFKDLD